MTKDYLYKLNERCKGFNLFMLGIIIISAVLISGCNFADCSKGLNPNCYYQTSYDNCISNNNEQNKYCQCWANCELQPDAVGKNCHSMCERDWVEKLKEGDGK